MTQVTEQVGVSRYGDESAAQFSNAGTRYTFFTSEGPTLTAVTMNATTAGSTTLVQSKTNKTTKITPLNSSVFMAPNKEWANVNAGVTSTGQNFVANMTVSAMTNDQKTAMPTSYGKKTFVVSSNSGKNYQSGASYSHTAFLTYWGHDISWDVRPTAYFSSSATTTSKNPHSQALFPKNPSPRWFRRASVQVVTDDNYGSRAFFVYTDLLSTFYIYPVINAKANIEQYPNTSDWVISESNYKKFDVDWGSAQAPTIDNFTATVATGLTYIAKFSSAFNTWDADFEAGISSDYPDANFDSWMGGSMSGYNKYKNITPNQYLWVFNYNATRATTVAFQKGSPISVRNVEGTHSELYKHVGNQYAFPKIINDRMGDSTALEAKPKVANAPTEQVCDYYPVLMEVGIAITIGKEVTDFSVAFSTTKNDSSQYTDIFYLGSGYTYPKFKTGSTTPISGDDLVCLSMSCYGDTTSYDPAEKPYDIYFEKLGDPNADKDLPANIPSADKELVKMLVSGKYDEATIGAFVESIDGYTDYFTAITAFFKDWSNGTMGLTTTSVSDIIKGCASSVAISYNDLNGTPQVINVDPMALINGNNDIKKILGYELKMYGVSTYFSVKITYAIFADSKQNWLPNRTSASSPLGKLREYMQSQGYNSDWVTAKHTFNKEADIAAGTVLTVMFFLMTILQVLFWNTVNSPLSLLTTVPAFDKLLRDYCYKNQSLAWYYEHNSNNMMLMCIFYVMKKCLEDFGVGDAQRDLFLSLYAQSVYREYPDIEYAGVTSWTDTYYDKLPVISSQVIDGVVFPNSILSWEPSPNSSFVENLGTGPTDRTQRRFKIDNAPSYSRAMYFMQDNSGIPYGKKIPKFKSVLEIRVNGNVTKEFLLIDAPYIAMQPLSAICASYPMLTYTEGDLSPYLHRATLVDSIQQVDNDWTVIKGLGYQDQVYEQFWVNGGNSESVARYHTNAVTFGLFIKTDPTTKANNVIAVDYPTSSLMFYGTNSNYHYPSDYSVGSCLYINGVLEEAYGTFLDSSPDAIGDKATKLPLAQFNMIYHYVAARQMQEDITQLQSLYRTNSLMYPNGTAIDPAHIIPDNFVYIATAEAKVIESVLVSHPNGSIAAYSLPPLGFLYIVGTDDPNVMGNYDPAMTIDYVKLLIPNSSSTKAPEYTISTHKEMFNKAFSQGRDYSYYTDMNTEGFMGGFCTAAVFYDFNLPKEYSYLANNYTAP